MLLIQFSKVIALGGFALRNNLMKGGNVCYHEGVIRFLAVGQMWLEQTGLRMGKSNSRMIRACHDR